MSNHVLAKVLLVISLLVITGLTNATDSLLMIQNGMLTRF